MLACKQLRIEPGDNSPVVDYRITNESVEIHQAEDDSWHRLTPEQLAREVMSNRTLAFWLRRRMGLHSLVRACNEDQSSIPNDAALQRESCAPQRFV